MSLIFRSKQAESVPLKLVASSYKEKEKRNKFSTTQIAFRSFKIWMLPNKIKMGVRAPSFSEKDQDPSLTVPPNTHCAARMTCSLRRRGED